MINRVMISSHTTALTQDVETAERTVEFVTTPINMMTNL